MKFRVGTEISNMFLCLIILWPVDNEGLIISKLVLFTAEEQPNKSKCEFKFFKLLFKFIYIFIYFAFSIIWFYTVLVV